MAERRARTTANDRRLISDRTAKSLRLLATPLRIYRERPGRAFPARRTVNLSDYLSAPPNEMDVEDDEEDLDTVLDSYADGARLNQDLLDAYGFWPTRRVFTSSPSPPAEDAMTRPAAAGRHSWSSNPGSIPGLRRQPSIRLSSRSRTVDFNDFTSRRRTSIREALSTRPEGIEGPLESREREVGRGPRPSTRRFFPFGRNRPHESAGSAGSQDSDAQNGDGADEGFTYVFEPSVSGSTWVPLTSAARSASPDHHEPTRYSADMSGERVRQPIPRLRRGTVRAPESLFTRYDTQTHLEHPVSSGSPTNDPLLEHRARSAELIAYPTPGSTENESS